jgi:signal transduction histidine kinase/DNA-binding response OmpR family regulator
MKVWHPHLTTKVASSFLLLSLLTVAVVGSVAFVKARHALKSAAFDRLSVTATLKEGEITRWFEEQERDFFLITQFPDIQSNLAQILEQNLTDPDTQAAHDDLSNYLREIATIKANFKELFVVDRTNKVILSTNQQREGEYEILANITYLNWLEPDSTFAPIFYVSAETGKPAVTLAAPYRDRAGVRRGLILAHLNLDRIDQIVRDRTGLGQSGETYLVGSLVIGNAFISKESIQTRNFSGTVSSYGIDAAMRGERNISLYKNYAGVPVIGVYRWLNDQDIALLAEMSQDEAFLPARQLASTIVLVGLLSVSVLTMGVYWLTHQLHLYRLQLESYSHRLEQKAQEANAANLAKSKFLANMSHELRTPLNAILGFAQLMVRDRSINPSHKEHLEIINRSGEHLLTLINDVLEMSKIEAGRIALNENNFDLYRLLDSLEEMLTLKARSKGLWLTFDRHPDLPQYIRADEGKLRQILINLIGNAIKFTVKGGVTLHVKPGAGEWQVASLALTVPDQLITAPYPLDFEVEDTGNGIAPHEMPSLFEPFVQTETGRKSKQGTGLGLPISRQYVSLMGGEIRVSSVPDRGTTFGFNVWVKLASAGDVLPHRVPRSIIGLAPNQPNYRILIIEDKWENRQLLVKMLSPLGFEIREAENGEEGVNLWESWEPHLIWMDMRMPLMDGYEATKRIRSHLKGQATVIIALTASAFEEARSVILAAGCDDFVRKPFQEHIIFDKMAEHLGVRYIYAEDSSLHAELSLNGSLASQSATASTAMTASTALSPSDLSLMPADWIEQLHQAAMRVNTKQISQLIEQIPSTHVHLAESIMHMANNFYFEEIVALTQQISASPQNSHKQSL